MARNKSEHHQDAKQRRHWFGLCRISKLMYDDGETKYRLKSSFRPQAAVLLRKPSSCSRLE